MTPLNARDDELWKKPSVASQFPVCFENGTEWTSIVGYCADCGRAIPDGDLRGLVTRLLPKVACVDAVGVCRSCRLLTRFYWRLHDDFRLTGLSKHGWGEWRPERSILSRISGLLRTLLRA